MLCFTLREAIATFDQFFQWLDEPRGGCAIDQIMIEAQRQAEIFPDSYSSHGPFFHALP